MIRKVFLHRIKKDFFFVLSFLLQAIIFFFIKNNIKIKASEAIDVRENKILKPYYEFFIDYLREKDYYDEFKIKNSKEKNISLNSLYNQYHSPFLYNYREYYDIWTAIELNQKKYSLESDSIIMHKDFTEIKGNAILKNIDFLINSEKIFYSNKAFTDNKKYLFLEMDHVSKIKTFNGDYLYAKYTKYDELKKYGLLKDVIILPDEFRLTTLYSKEIELQEDKKIVGSNTFISLCEIPSDIITEDRETNYSLQREIPFYKNSPKEDTDFQKNYENRYKKILNLNVKIFTYNKETQFANFWHSRLELFSIPFFYLPFFSYYTGEEGTSGFLFPKIFARTKQVGIEIPLYLKLRNDMDLIISRTQYFDIKRDKNLPNEPAYDLLDLSRMRSSGTGIKFRHLLSENYNYQSFYNFEAFMTDKTNLVNNNNGLARLDENNNNISGYRGYFNLSSAIKLSRTTYLYTDWMMVSDRSFLYTYKFDFRGFKQNEFSLYDIADNRYLSFNLINLAPILYQYDSASVSNFVPIIKMEYDFQKDKIGGNFYSNFNFSHIHREYGYKHTQFAFDIGYTLPYQLPHDIEFQLDSLIRNKYDNYQFANSKAQNILTDGFTKFYGSYNTLLSNPLYISNINNIGDYGSYYQILNFNKIQLQKKFIIDGDTFTTIIEPKVALRYVPTSGRLSFIPNDDAILFLNNNNIFSLMYSSGLGIYDSGLSSIYGINVKNKMIYYDIELDTTIAQSIRLHDIENMNYLPEYSGLSQSISDTIVQNNLKIDKFTISNNIRYDQYRKQLREWSVNLAYQLKYLALGVGYMEYSSNASILNKEMKMLNTNFNLSVPNISYIAKYVSNINFFGMLGFNFSNEQQPFFNTPKIGLIFSNFGLKWDLLCSTMNLSIIQNYMSLQGLPNDTQYRFNASFKF